MFPSMRRHLQQISYERAIDILRKTTNAVLAIRDDITGYTYAVPVSPVYDEGHLYIHSAPMGHKIAALKANPKVSLCVIEKDEIHGPLRYRTKRKTCRFRKTYRQICSGFSKRGRS